MSEQVEQDFIALLKTGENKINPSYFETARSFNSRTIDIRGCVQSILKENITACMKKENLYECFGEPRMHNNRRHGPYFLYFHFAVSEGVHYTIDLFEDYYGQNWSIEIAHLKGADNLDTIDDITKTIPHPKIKIMKYRQSKPTMCMGTPKEGGEGAYFQYIGAEDAYHDTVIQVLRAFHTYYNGDIKIVPE